MKPESPEAKKSSYGQEAVEGLAGNIAAVPTEVANLLNVGEDMGDFLSKIMPF